MRNNLESVLEIMDEFVGKKDTALMGARAIIKKVQRRQERLEACLGEALDILCSIRYCEWPEYGLSKGFERLVITAIKLDEVIMEADKLVPMRKKVGRGKSTG